MQYKKLGLTNLKVSCLGFGGCPIGAHGWGKVKDKDSVNAIRKAVDLGINFFDTADTYGLGHSEEILAMALGENRKKVVIATKGGVVWDPVVKKSHYDLSPQHLRTAVEHSLRRLKIDCLPLYQLHYPDPQTPIGETVQALEILKKEGKIQYIGFSNFSAESITEAQKYGRFESSQTSYNLIDRSAEKTLFSVCRQLKMSVLVYGPLAQGLLSGKYTADNHFGPDDRRSRAVYKNFHDQRLKANLVIIEELKKIAQKYQKTCAQIALRWILDNPLITTVIVGAKTPQQIQENCNTLDWTLAPEDERSLAQIVERTHGQYGIKD